MEKNESAYEKKYARALEDGKRLKKTHRPRADIRTYLSRTFRLKADDLDGIMSTLYESAGRPENSQARDSLDGILNNSAQFRYMMLSRFVGDTKYYLANGRSERTLWSGNAAEHADNMVRLYDSFSEDEKPEWLTKSELDRYVKELRATGGKPLHEGIVSTKDGEKTFDELYGKDGIETDHEDGQFAVQFAHCFEATNATAKARLRETAGHLMESLADMPDWMEGALKEFIRENYRFKEAEGHFYGSIDPDYRDELDKESIQRILTAENPMEEFDSIIDEGDFGFLDDEYNSLMVEMMHKFDDWAQGEGFDAEGSFESWEQDIEQWVYENVSFSLNTSQYLKTDIHTVLIVDSGDGDYDFTLNTEFDDGEVDPQAGIIWLASTQGYTKEDVEAALNDGDYKDSKFLKSLAQEVANCTTSINAIAFLQDMELKDLVEREPGDVPVDVRVTCGLFDPWNGAGGMFEIALEKPVTVPKDFIRSYNVDGAFGRYGIGQVYGQWLD